MSFPVPIQPPADGFDKMEQAFLRQMVIDVFRKIPRTEDKFIVMAIHGMGYPQEVVAEMLGKSQVRICVQLKKITQYIRNKNTESTV